MDTGQIVVKQRSNVVAAGRVGLRVKEGREMIEKLVGLAVVSTSEFRLTLQEYRQSILQNRLTNVEIPVCTRNIGYDCVIRKNIRTKFEKLDYSQSSNT